MRVIRQVWYGTLYYVSWCVFGVGGLLLNLVCTPLLLLGGEPRHGAFARRAIQYLFQFWLKWLHVTGVVDVRWRRSGFTPQARAAVYVANHPSLVDATFLLAHLPNAVCIFKPALLRNPVIAPAARLAGYIVGDQGVDTIRAAADAIASGRSLLIFPEGTRTEPGQPLNPLRPGFALIARRAAAPVQLIHLQVSKDLVPRGRPWWLLPPLPGWVRIERRDVLEVEHFPDSSTLVDHAAAILSRAPLPDS